VAKPKKKKYTPKQLAAAVAGPRQQNYDVIESQQYPFGSLAGLHYLDGRLTTGVNMRESISAMSAMMQPFQAEQFSRWARSHPQMDPRTWAPLAEAYIDPMTPEGHNMAMADIARQVADGTFGAGPGVTTNPIGLAGVPTTGTQQPAPASVNPAPDVGPGGDGLGRVLGDWLGNAANAAMEGVQGFVRGSLTALSAPLQGGEATARQVLGNQEEMQKIADKYGLSLDEAASTFPDLGGQNAAAGNQAAAPNVNARFGRIDNAGKGNVLPFDQFASDRRDLMQKAKDEWNAMERSSAGAGLSSIAMQTDLGQTVADPSLMFDKDKGGTGFLPNPVAAQKAEEVAIRAYDIRKADEIKRGVAPTAWTLGRGIAHEVADIDTQKFYNLSGLIDFGKSMTMDPVNLVPVGKAGSAAGKLAELMPGTLSRALAGTEQAVVHTTEEAAAAARWSARGERAVDRMTGVDRRAPEIPKKATVDESGTRGYFDVNGNYGVVKNGRSWELRDRSGEVLSTHRTMRDAVAAASENHADRFIAPEAPVFDSRVGARQTTNDKGLTGYHSSDGRYSAVKEGKVWTLYYRGESVGAHDTLKEAKAAAGEHFDNLDWKPDVPDYGGPVYRETEEGYVETPNGTYVAGDRAYRYLTSGRGAKIVDGLVGNNSPWDIYARTKGRLDIGVAEQLADAKSADEVRAILATHMGVDIRQAKDMKGLVPTATPNVLRQQYLRDTPLHRFLRLSPTSEPLNLEGDIEEGLRNLERWGRGLGMTHDQITPYMDRVIRAQNGAERYSAIFGHLATENSERVPGLVDEVKNILIAKGVNRNDAHNLTRAYQGGLDETMRDSLVRDAGWGADGAGADTEMLARVRLENEQLGSTVALPDYREIRRHTTVMGALRNKLGDSGMPLAKVEKAMADAAENITSIWRSSVLIRGAYVLREIGELAFSMSLGGYAGAFTHPAAFLSQAVAAATAKDLSSKWSRAIADLGWNTAEATARLADGDPAAIAAMREFLHGQDGVSRIAPWLANKQALVTGKGMWDDFNKFQETGDVSLLADINRGLSAIHGNFNVDVRAAAGASRHSTPHNILDLDPDTGIPRDAHAYAKALLERLVKMRGDRDMRNIASDLSPDEVLDQFRNGSLRVKQEMSPELLDGSPGAEERYLDMYRTIMSKFTGDDPVLREAIATGKHNGKGIVENRDLVKHIEARLADPEFRKAIPDVLHTISLQNKWYGTTSMAERYMKATDEFFKMTGDFSDLFARAPLLRAAYVKRVKELGDYIAPATRDAIVANLEKAGDKALAREMRMAPAKGTLTLEEVDHIAQSFARKENARLFYDAHARQNYALSFRVVAPFAQATFNTFRRWGEMSLKNPQMMYRSLKPLVALEQPGSAAIYGAAGAALGDQAMEEAYFRPGHPEESVNGFFFEDPQFRDRKFAYPIVSAPLAMLALGTTPDGIGYTSSLSGLNVAGTSVNPGTGPLVTFPAAMFGQAMMAKDDMVGAMMRSIFPFGLPTGSMADRAFGSFLPTVAQKAEKATDESSVASMAIKMISPLADTGAYDMSNQGGQRQLVSDATDLASRLWLLSAIGGSMTPSTFNPTAIIRAEGDKTGGVRRFMLQSRLAAEYQKYTKDDKNTGTAEFVRDYGGTALMSVLTPTQTSGPQSTNDVWRFRSQEPDTYDRFQPVIGLFFAGGSGSFGEKPNPDDPTGFAQPLYNYQKVTGERTVKDPDAYIQDVNKELGWLLYNTATKEIDEGLLSGRLDDQQAAVLREQRRLEISQKFPGWTGKAGSLERLPATMVALREAVSDPVMSTLESAAPIRTYLDARDKAVEALHQEGHTGDFKSNAGSVYAKQLTDLAVTLAEQDKTGAFRNAWNRLFKQEFEFSKGGE